VDSAAYDKVAQCGDGGQPKFDLLRTHKRLQYRMQVRRWSEPVDFPLLLSQTKYNRSLAPDEADVDSATHDMVAQCGDGGQHKFDLLRTHTRLQYRMQVRRWSEQAAFPLLLFQTKYKRSLAPDEADVDSAAYDMVAQCGAGGQSKFVFLRTHKRLQYRMHVGRWSEPVDFSVCADFAGKMGEIARDIEEVARSDD
jgi:L-arabinose isomerase